MTTIAEEVQEGSSLPDSRGVDPAAQMRACARESVALPARGSLASVTQRVRRAGEVASLLAAMANKPGTVLHSQPPTFWQAWDRHKECAGHFGPPLLRWLRLAWGCLHLLVILPPLYLLSWITESPLRLFITAALSAVIWYFWAPAGF